MEDKELDLIRQKRMAELQQQQQGFGGEGGAQQQQQKEAQRQQQMDMKNSILAQVLNQEARARWGKVSTLALTKPEKAGMVENHLVNMARTGQIMNKLGEDQLITLLEKLSEQTQKKTVVRYDRRRMAIDSDED